METVIIGFYRSCGDSIFFRDPLCGMALRTGGHCNPSLMDRRIRVHFGFDPMEPMIGGTGGGIASSPCCKHSMDALGKLFGHIGMALPAGLGDIGTEDRGFGIDEGSQAVASVAIRTGDLTRLSMNAFFEFLFRQRCTKGMLLDK